MGNLDKPRGKFHIVPKRDFGSGPGFWMKGAGSTGTDNYGFVKSGFIVTDGFCNVMPGATWFRTVEDAVKAIRIFVDCETSDQFWERVRNT